MKLRESGMPEEALWEGLFDVPLILARLQIDPAISDVIELGCGYGTFTLPVAAVISGTIHAFDIDPDMVTRTAERAAEAGLVNVVCRQRDVVADGYGLPDASVDGAMLFNILHGESPVALLDAAARVVRPGGSVWAIHWRYDPATPRGPSMDIRPHPEMLAGWARDTGRLEETPGCIDLPPWHYGWRFVRTGNP